jgi:hypothetical protein
MLGSPLLGTAVGLVLLFAATALLCSGITETLSNILQLRAKYLLTGMRTLLDAPERKAGEGDRALAGTTKAIRAAKDGVRAAKDAARAAKDSSRAAKDGSRAAGTAAERERGGAKTAMTAAATAVRLAAGKEQRNALHEQVKQPATTMLAAMAVRRLITNGGPSPKVPGSLVTTALWDSPLLTSLQSRRVGGWWTGTLRNPQYVSGRTFAQALVDLLVPTTPDGTAPAVVTIGRIQHSVEMLPTDLPLRRPLLGFLARAGSDVDTFERAVEQWYDEQMAKIAGWYKRWARVVLGIVGFVVAVLVNVDTMQVAHSLYVDAPVQQAVVATASAGTLCRDEATADDRTTCATQELKSLQAAGLPFGYPGACDLLSTHWAACWEWADGETRHWWDFPLKLAGWVITGFAVSFGAPFWFEALSKLGSLRTAGTRPASTA